MNKKIITFFLLLIMLIVIASEVALGVSAVSIETTFSAMHERAEALVNYEWVPTERIYTWNNNLYNGKNYFEKGETVKGVPYTLFAWELGFDGLLSLKQYKSKASQNYSTTAYCSSVKADRTGPVYGNCCATLVSEVFGGNFMSGDNPRYDGVGTVEGSTYATCYTNVSASAIQPGDALSCTSGAHIVWVSEVTDDAITIYESTPPICRKVVLDKASHTNSNGYLVYDKNIYNIVTKSNEIIRDDLSNVASLDYDTPMPIKAYTQTTEKTIVYDSIDGKEKSNKIYSTDLCFIDAVFANGWCHVNFPLDTGGLDHGYVKTSVFYDYSYDISIEECTSNLSVYSRSDLSEVIGKTAAGYDMYFVGNTPQAYQIIYPLSAGGYKLGYISKEELDNAEEPPFLNELCPIKGYPCVDKDFEVKTEDYTTRGGEIYTTDYCTINQIYGDGWCQVTFPMNTGGTRTAYTQISNFVYDTGYQMYEYITKEEIDVYTKKDLVSSPSWWTGIGDTIYVISEYEDAVQICYPIDESYGGGYKFGWIPEDVIKEETDKELVSIEVCSKPNKTKYKVGESLDTTGLSVELVYSDNTTSIVTVGFSITGFDSSTSGEKTITVTMDGKRATFVVEVIESTIEGIIGDVDGDGKITDWDAILLNRHLAGWNTSVGLLAGDTDKDGKVSDWDAIVLERYLAGWEIELGN